MCKTVEEFIVAVPNLDVPPKTYLHARLRGDEVKLASRDTGELLAIVSAKGLEPAFRRRSNIAAVVKSNDGNIAIVQLVRFVDVHRHSGFSFLDGGIKIEDLVRKTEFAGAITDHGGMFGALDYYTQMTEAGKQPILGFEAYAETINGFRNGNHLLLLAKNEVGYKNLTKLTSLSQDNFYRHPHVSYDMLADHSEGVISTTTCMGSEISQLLVNRNYDEAKYVTKQLSEIFGKDDFYVEIQRHGFDDELIVNPQLLRIAKELDLKVVATTDAHFVEEEDREAHDVLLCIGTGKLMSDEGRIIFPGSGYHLHTPDEIEELFADIPEALDNTIEIAEKCADFKLDLGRNYLPHFKYPKEFNSEMEYLRHLVGEIFKERFSGTPALTDPVYLNRLKFELDTIEGMGFPGYFLIVNDFISWAESEGILVGPGRGSAAGSLVAYCLRITDLDPIPYGLLFERFLNPDRISMPDIDIDFQDDRRDEVIAYVREKYGAENVSKIITFTTIGAKTAIRDVSRVLDVPLSIVGPISKAIPNTPKITLDEALEESPEFREKIESSPQMRKVLEIARKLEGLPRQQSQHACGLVISPGKVSDYLPTVMMANKLKVKELTSQYDKREVELVGLLKMDFLGLRTLQVIAKALALINKRRSKEGKSDIRYLDIPLNDPKVYQDIAKGDTYGVFQLESPGMRAFMKELYQDAHTFKKPSNELFERLIAGVSLYRPGPMDHIPEYIENMKNPKGIKYDHPLLKDILAGTYGIITYQEQTMQTVQALAGFTKGEADNVRKAFSSKNQKMIPEIKKNFIGGSVKNGLAESLALLIWSKMESFSEYAFNKSHGAVYGMLSAITAWLKYYYPVEFMTAVLNSYRGKNARLKIFLTFVQRMGIEILPADVNYSEGGFSVEGNAIRFGFQGLKGVNKISDLIVAEREARGKFTSMQDFAERMAKNQKINRSVIQSMIYAGALDAFEGTRRAKMDMLEDLMNYLAVVKKEKTSTDQMSLLDFMDEDDVAELSFVLPVPDLPEMDKRSRLALEKEYAGFYITEHPLDDYQKHFERENVLDIGLLIDSGDDEDELENEDQVIEREIDKYEGKKVKLAGIINNLEVIYTKKDQLPMYKFEIEDRTGEFNAIVFNSDLERNRQYISEGRIVLVEGIISISDFGPQIIVQQVVDIEQIEELETPKLVWVKSNDKDKVKKFLSFLDNHPGDIPVNIVYDGKAYRSKKTINLDYANYSKLEGWFGKSVKIDY